MAQCAQVPQCCSAEAQAAAPMADGEAQIRAALPMCGYLVRSQGQVSPHGGSQPLGMEVSGGLQPSIHP